MDYQDEFGVGNTQGQHLHFLVWSRPTSPATSGNIDCSGTDQPSWWGIVYMPGATVTTLGNCGKKAAIPWVTGQVVANQYKGNGNASLTVYYRPCLSGAICGTGPGTELIQ